VSPITLPPNITTTLLRVRSTVMGHIAERLIPQRAHDRSAG